MLLMVAPIRLASVALSLVDFLLARPLAIIVGAGWRGWKKRYAHFLAVMTLIASIALCAPAETAAVAVLVGVLGILGLVRRWSWIEGDRTTFLIERGQRTSGPGSIRIGFREDLRDEALFALACLLLLIPLGFDAVQQASCNWGSCAFSLEAHAPASDSRLDRLYLWLGYFGAELAKTIPFVDWSEVFHVANGSPLQPVTPLGSQLTFILRVGLDLLFLAAVLQAVQIAVRLRDQEYAFAANRLPILEPFSERRKFSALADEIDKDLTIRPSEQPVVIDFPSYDTERLMEIAGGGAEERDIGVRKAAAAVLQAQFERAPDRLPDIPIFWTRQLQPSQGETDPALRGYFGSLASGLDPAHDGDVSPRQRRYALRLSLDRGADVRGRISAIHLLGRIKLDAASFDSLLHLMADKSEHLDIRAACSVSLAKTEDFALARPICDFVATIPDDPRVVPAVCAAGYALGWMGASVEDVASHFESLRLREHASMASRVQRQPMSSELAKQKRPRSDTSQLVRLTPGSAGYPKSFTMGSPRREKGSDPTERPLRRGVKISKAFALGRFTVTNGEYLAYLAATSTPDATDRSDHDAPATWLSWHEALSYCRWLNSFTGERYRLPTEVEWEYACRCGTRTRYSWGDAWDGTRARSNEMSPDARSRVGSFPPNPWGLWEMHGNVYEWVADPWHPNFRGDPPKDERVWLDDADYSLRIIRGGSGSSAPSRLRSAFRYGDFSTFRYHFVGFRLAKTLKTIS